MLVGSPNSGRDTNKDETGDSSNKATNTDDEGHRPLLQSRQRLRILPNSRSICEMVIQDDSAQTPAKMLDIEILMLTVGGKERTAEEFSGLFAWTGLRLGRMVPTTNPICVIEGVPS